MRRNLHRAYVMQLGKLMEGDGKSAHNDVNAAARGALKEVRRAAKSATPRYSEDMMKYHLQDLVAQIDALMEVD